MQKKKRIRLKVASPCEANWDAMTGDEAVRFCGLCKKNVYQISNMSNDQVEELLAEAGEEKCGRFYQRSDGTLVTADCSIGLKRKRRKQAIVTVGAGIVSAIGLAIGSAGSPPPAAQSPDQGTTIVEHEELELLMGAMEFMPEELEEPEEEVAPIEKHKVVMGRIRRVPAPSEDVLSEVEEPSE